METTNKMKRQKLSKWEKMFANEAPDKGLIFKIHKDLMQLYQKMGRKTKYVYFPKKAYKWPTHT